MAPLMKAPPWHTPAHGHPRCRRYISMAKPAEFIVFASLVRKEDIAFLSKLLKHSTFNVEIADDPLTRILLRQRERAGEGKA